VDILKHVFYDGDIEAVLINGDKIEFDITNSDTALLFNEADVIAMAKHYGLYILKEEHYKLLQEVVNGINS
jgi:hypothetical protein